MAQITYQNKVFTTKEEETVLDVFLRNGQEVQFSCKKGTCQTCMMKCAEDTMCAKSQEGLEQNLKDKKYFLPCVCVPTLDMEVVPNNEADYYHSAKVVERNMLADDVLQIKLELESDFQYHAGQYVHLKFKDTDEVRPYSLASLPMVDTYLELHIKRIPAGKFSNWIFDELKVGEIVEIQNAVGDSYYSSENKRQNLLLIGTGTGLSPLLGIVKDALVLNSHDGKIYLYHGGSSVKQLYLQKELRELDVLHDNFHYVPCISGDDISLGYEEGRANTLAFNSHKELADWKIHLCGHPDMVSDSTNVALSFGAMDEDIYADPFDFQSSIESNRSKKDVENPYELEDEKVHYPEPDLELWAALGEGELLTEILTEFYTTVFADPRLSPFFSHVTMQRLIEKQYNFLYQTFTGKKVYFGANLRNAHHWMVISDELFDYRADILESLMRKHGLSEDMIKRWVIMEELARDKIVKPKPWDKILDGKMLHLDKFEEATMEVSTLCDSCQSEIEAGEKIRYHLRLGKAFCSSCAGIEVS